MNRCSSPWQEMIIDLTGEVVPCCFWSGYGNDGKPLGNTNESTLEEIWNGDGYRQLRKRVADGDLEGHPCGNCMAARWANGRYPGFRWPAGIDREEGYCYISRIPSAFERQARECDEDVLLLEEGKPLAWPDALHDEIRKKGCGRYSVWKGWVYFSSSDNSDPTRNGRKYVLKCGDLTVRLGNMDVDSVSGRNLILAHEEYLAGREIMQARPTVLSLISSADCNIDCPACSQNLVRLVNVQHRPETVPSVLSMVPYLSRFTWHGGEPYLIRKFRNFVDTYRREDNPNLVFGFTSNGTMITSAEMEKLRKFPGINISISIDSFNRETFGKIRKNANFDLVLGNTLRLVQEYSEPDWIVKVGMIVCKTNMPELAENLRFAIEHDIGLNLSPVVVYPVTEQLNVFEDFHAQTAGWDDAIEEAGRIVERALKERRPAVERVDPSGMVQEIRAIYEREKARYARWMVLEVMVADPDGSIGRMSRPGIIFHDSGQRMVSYLELKEGQERYLVKLPCAEADAPERLAWHLVHDLHEPLGILAAGRVRSRGVWWRWGRHSGLKAQIVVPDFSSPPRSRNIKLANYGESAPSGLQVRHPLDIEAAYKRLHGRRLVR